MGSEPYLKDFVRSGVLNDRSRSGRPTGFNQEKVSEVNDFFQTHLGLNVRSVAEDSRYQKEQQQQIELGLNIDC